MLTDKQLFLFDIDGTLCLGDTWIDGARELLALLKAQGSTIFSYQQFHQKSAGLCGKVSENGADCG